MTPAAAASLAAFGDRFELRQEYAGGEGRTLRVREAATGRDLVLKILPPDASPQEASLLLALQHPAIPAVREVGRLPDGSPFVLRDHVEGQPLTRLPAEPAAVLALVRELLEALAFVHLRSVLHLDLKPQNLLRDPQGRLHLLDFGLGARRGERGLGGTPFFAAPEVLLGGVPDLRADLFAVGAIAALALWPDGRPPLARFLQAFPGTDFFTAGGVRPDRFPAPFDAFLPRCLARRPARRFQDAQAALEFLFGGSGRPSPFLLAPDPVQLFAPELAAAGGAGGRDVALHGSTSEDRQTLGMHLVATLPGARALARADGALRVCRGGDAGGGDGDGDALRIELPTLAPERFVPHLQDVFGLQGSAAHAAARWLADHGGTSGSGAAAVLRRLLAAGELEPAGTRWSWPAALAGRLGTKAPIEVDPTPANVHAAAVRGRREHAIALWQRGAEAAPARERELRAALVEGLLDGGEPAPALTLCAGLPSLRAEALLDAGQVAAAGEQLAALPPPQTARQRGVLARWHLARGDDSALRVLQHPDATPRERLILAASLDQRGDAASAAALLHALLPSLPAAAAPFLRASALTVLGHSARQLGNLLDARQHFADAAELLFAMGHVRHAATAQLNLGVIEKDLGRHDRAVEHLRQARAQYQHAGDAGGTATAEANLGIAALARGDAAAARPWLERAAEALLRIGNTAAGRLAQVMLARAHAELGQRDDAQRLLAAIGEPVSARMRDEVGRVLALLQPTAPSPAADRGEPGGRLDRDADDEPPRETMPPNQGPSRELFRTFLAVNRQLAQETNLDKAMQHLLDAAVTLTGGRQGYLLVTRQDGVRREFQSGDAGAGGAGQAFSRSLANRAIAMQRTLTGDEALQDRELQEMPSIRNLQVRSAICAPFRSAGGTTGAIYVEHGGRAGVFQDADKESLEVLADQAAIAVDRMLREEALEGELQQSKKELAVERRAARRDLGQLLGESPAMRELKTQLQRLAPLDLPVLVLGETGTGKELVARALHDLGARPRGPFVAENCSALPAELMERELFGHVQGAFTGADRDRPGLLEMADGGTLFLDEVGDMPLSLQAKLLRALQEQSIRRVGGSANIRLDLRLVAATHKDLRAMVQRGEFREDLFFRLAAVELRVPPLRERAGDVALLAEAFVKRHDQRHGTKHRLSPAALDALVRYPWPGNVRELEHVVARACLLGDGEVVFDLHLPPGATAPAGADATATDGAPPGIAPRPAESEVLTLKEAERRAIAAALRHCNGDKAKTARTLGISRTALYEKLKRQNL